MSLKEESSSPKSGCSLKKPVQIVKKRSGPLDDILNEVNSEPQEAINDESKQKPTISSCSKDVNPEIAVPTAPSVSGVSTVGHLLYFPRRRLSHLKDREKKRERWLLTRKTWKYMTDAGRKLIPDGVQNRKEDIPKIDAHFQEVCASEPRFILWRRKSSYPGAIRNSKRRLRQLLHHTGQKHSTPQTVEQVENEEAENADQIIHLLQTHLKLDEARKTTALLGSKTVRPDQTSSPSAQRPSSSTNTRQFISSSTSMKNPWQQISNVDQLLERLKALQRSATTPIVDIPPELITHDILKDKTLLKQIYNSLKKQQLHRILSRHSNAKGFSKGLSTYSLSLSNLNSFSGGGGGGGGVGGGSGSGGFSNDRAFNNIESRATENIVLRKCIPESTKSPLQIPTSEPSTSKKNTQKRSPPRTLNIPKKTAPLQGVKKKSYNTCGVQTNFIQLNEIKRLAEEYKERKQEEAASRVDGAGGPDVETEKPHAQRKTSIDNEDVSQSVSDTIKRYLRMARKKSVHESDANRFKRVNYDRNLRNIRAKGEINPPGMDEGNSKATQTLDAWPLITLDFIRGNESKHLLEEAHAEWKKDLEERLRNKLEYERKMNESCDAAKSPKSMSRSCSSSSAPTSPTSPVSTSSERGLQKGSPGTNNYEGNSHTSTIAGSIFHSSTQFLSNIWHGGQQHDGNSGKNKTSLHGNTAEKYMQKSKSTSNVGHIVSRKILRGRSKSQSRLPSAIFANDSKWAPAEKCTWLSDNGVRLQLSDALLQNLSDVEAKYLQRVALEKISELNVGIIINRDSNGKAQKRRVLPKKKAMTTNFFEIGRKDERGKNFSIFGNSLECCVANDKKSSGQLNGGYKDHSSRGSISSLFRSGSENVRSCESLPSSTNVESGGVTSGNFDYLTKSSSMLMSTSQWDMRRKSMDYDESDEFPKVTSHLQVPTFISSCIEYLEKNGMHEVGLFRVSTSKKRVKQMREDFNKNVNRKFEAETSPHDVATLLKEFLRDLPEPLLCDNLYGAFLQTQKIRNRRLQLEAISHLIKLLPAAHRDTLYVMLRFLAQVAANSDDVISPDGRVYISGNKMDSNNLATVFAPNILRKKLKDDNSSTSNCLEAMSEHESMNDSINVVRTMIDHYEDLFRVPADLIDIAYSYMLDECPEQLFVLCEQQKFFAKDEISSPSSEYASPEETKDYQQGLEKSSTAKFHTRTSVTHDNNATQGDNTAAMEPMSSKGSRRYAETPEGQYSKQSSIERRQSSPNVLTKQNIISGSLQISVPKQIRDSDNVDPKRFLAESSEKPFVEAKVKTSRLSKGMLTMDPRSTRPTKTVDKKSKKPSSEPKLPTSISSIGGAILRSKTADFERLSLEKKSSVQRSGSKPTETGSSSMGQHLYKRKELISSSKGINSS